MHAAVPRKIQDQSLKWEVLHTWSNEMCLLGLCGPTKSRDRSSRRHRLVDPFNIRPQVSQAYPPLVDELSLLRPRAAHLPSNQLAFASYHLPHAGMFGDMDLRGPWGSRGPLRGRGGIGGFGDDACRNCGFSELESFSSREYRGIPRPWDRGRRRWPDFPGGRAGWGRMPCLWHDIMREYAPLLVCGVLALLSLDRLTTRLSASRPAFPASPDILSKAAGVLRGFTTWYTAVSR